MIQFGEHRAHKVPTFHRLYSKAQDYSICSNFRIQNIYFTMRCPEMLFLPPLIYNPSTFALTCFSLPHYYHPRCVKQFNYCVGDLYLNKVSHTNYLKTLTISKVFTIYRSINYQDIDESNQSRDEKVF